MRFRTSGHTDVEWDFDYDTGAKKYTSSNVFIDARKGQLFGGISYALPQRSRPFLHRNHRHQ